MIGQGDDYGCELAIDLPMICDPREGERQAHRKDAGMCGASVNKGSKVRGRRPNGMGNNA